MYESMQSELSNKMSMAQVKGENAQQKANNIGIAVNALTEAVQTGMDIYGQSTINKEKYDLMQKLNDGQEQFLDVDNENASIDYTNWCNQVLDEYVQSKSPIMRNYFSQYKQGFLDKARETFDTQLANRIGTRNQLNAIETWNKAIKAYSNGEDMSVFEMKDIYRTTFGEDGLKVVHDRVKIGNLYDTESEDLSDRQKSFNQLLNILYESQCLATDQDSAKMYVNSKIPEIEQSLMQNDIISMASEWAVGLDMGDGNTRHFTEDELKEQIKSQYLEGYQKPYTGEKITSSESKSISDFVDAQVSEVYSKIYSQNKMKLLTDADGFFEAQLALDTPFTSDILYGYLEQSGMIECKRDENGNIIGVKSWYGLDANMMAECEKIAKNNDRVFRADQIIMDSRNWGGDGILDITDFPSELKLIVTQDANGNYYVKDTYNTFTDSELSESAIQSIYDTRLTPEIKEDTVTKINALSEFIGWDYNSANPPTDNAVYKYYENLMRANYGENWESQDDYTKEVMKTMAYSDYYADVADSIRRSGDSSLSTYFSAMTDRFKDIVKVNLAEGASAEVAAQFDAEVNGVENWAEDMEGPASLKDLIAMNHAYKQGFSDTIEKYARKQVGELDEYSEAHIKSVLDAQYENNENEIDRLCEKWYKDAGYQNAKAMKNDLEKFYTYGDKMATQWLKDEVERTANRYVSDLETLTVIESDGYRITSSYGYESTGARTANMVFDVSNKNMKSTLKGLLGAMSDFDKMSLGLDKVDVDNLVSEDEKAAIAKKFEGVEYDFQVNQLENAYLVTMLSLLTGGDAETISVYYNEQSCAKVETNLKSAYDDFQRDTKANLSYDSGEITIPSWADVKNSVNENIVDTVSKYGSFKVGTSASGVFNGYMNRIMQGQNPAYLKELAKSDPLLSESDTDKFLSMSEGELFTQLAGDGIASKKVKDFINKFDNAITQSYAWDAMFDVLSKANEEGNIQDLPRLIEEATNAFGMAYGEYLGENMFKYDENSTVYGVPMFNKGENESDATKNKINDYSKAFGAGQFNAAGINSLVNDYLNSDRTHMARVRAQIDAIAGNDEKMDRYCLVLALDSLGEPVELYNIDYDSDTFWTDINKYFGRLSKNDQSYDARYADHILRVAGSFKHSFGIFSPESVASVGEPGSCDFENNVFRPTSIHKDALDKGAYISYTEENMPILNVDDGSGSMKAIDISFTTETKLKELEAKIKDEVNDSINDSLIPAFNKYLNNPLNKGAENYDAVSRRRDDACDGLARISPTYKEYLRTCEEVSKYMDIPQKIGKAWYWNGGISFEFINGDVNADINTTSDVYDLMDMTDIFGFANNLPSLEVPKMKIGEEAKDAKALVDYLSGIVNNPNPNSKLPANMWEMAGAPSGVTMPVIPSVPVM